MLQFVYINSMLEIAYMNIVLILIELNVNGHRRGYKETKSPYNAVYEIVS